MSNPSRKKRKPDLFSPEAVQARLMKKDNFNNELASHIEFLRQVDVSALHQLTEDVALVVASAKVGLNALTALKCAIDHVPSSYAIKCRESGGVTLRTMLIHDIVHACCEDVEGLRSYHETEAFIKFLEDHCSRFMAYSVGSKEQLWELSKGSPYRFTKFLAPPLSTCLACEAKLTSHNAPSNARLFTLEGPVPATKICLECKACKITYGIAHYKDSEGSSRYYPERFKREVIEVSNATYVSQQLYNWLPSLSNHSWVSFSGFAESYNETYRKEIDRFENTIQVCHGFDSEDESEDVTSSSTVEATCGSIGCLSAKTAARSYWKRELEEELDDLGIRDKWSFKKSDGGQHLAGTDEDAMEFAERKRAEQLYQHNCSKLCEQKGCGKLYAADGNWKLRYAHCMWKVPVTVPGFGETNYPSICPLSPQRGHAFCVKHCAMAVAAGYPSDLRSFLKKCGVPDVEKFTELEAIAFHQGDSEDSGSSVNGMDAVEDTLKLCAGMSHPSDANASSFQGTADFLQSHPGFIDTEEAEVKVSCNKDTGGRKSLHCWSRGVFFIVSGGGHIHFWQPLYRSESPTQAYLIIAIWLYRKFKAMQDAGETEANITAAMSSTTLAYDNMCHVDSLKIAKKDLPFPTPMDKAWSSVNKVIDRLHLRNHKDSRCKQLYSADRIPPEYNTMACEQTFVWASRLKKIVCAMGRLHQFFFLHRSVKRRNKYTELCYSKNKTPVLPKLSLGNAS